MRLYVLNHMHMDYHHCISKGDTFDNDVVMDEDMIRTNQNFIRLRQFEGRQDTHLHSFLFFIV